jgi:hypothetical protein
MRPTINAETLSMMDTVNDDLDKRYGKIGTESRDDFDAKSRAWHLIEYSEEEEKAILQAMEANRGKAGDSAFLVIPSPKPKENLGDTLIEVDLDSL